MDIIKISAEQFTQIQNLQEDYFHEVKAKEISPSKLSESISAFANAQGGELYVGISEREDLLTPNKWAGFDTIENANPIFQMLDKIAGGTNFIMCTFLEHEKEKGYVLKIEILKNSAITAATNGAKYIRKGAQKLPVHTPEALRRLELDKGISSFEDNTSNSDKDTICNSTVIISFLRTVIPSAEPEQWLQKQQLIVYGKPTVAGILLFADDPQALLPKRSAIKLFRYKTGEKQPERDHLATDPVTIEGHAYALIFSAVHQTQQILEGMKKLGELGLEKIEYPPETLHEVITNAVLHRDYSIPTDIQIRVFDNRIEVESPGRLAGHVTIQNILDTQFARNQRIVRLINKFPLPPNKDVGEGLNTAFNAMRKLRLKDPEIQETESSVIVTIPHQKLASPEELIIDYLERNPDITNRVARELCNIPSENSVKRIFKKMESRGMIERVPNLPQIKAAWRYKKDEDSCDKTALLFPEL